MYLTQTLNLNEKQFLELCDEKGLSKSYSKRALSYIFQKADDMYTMEDEGVLHAGVLSYRHQHVDGVESCVHELYAVFKRFQGIYGAKLCIVPAGVAHESGKAVAAHDGYEGV